MRSDESNLVSETARSFHERGYAAIEAFSMEEAVEYRNRIVDLARADGGSQVEKWNLAHGVSSTPDLWSLISHERILGAVRDVLRTSDLLYAEHSALKVWRNRDASGWHRDSIDQRRGVGDGSRTDYRIVRVACYFQDPYHDFMWGAIEGSHRAERQLSRWERTLWRRVQAPPVVEIGSRIPHLSASPHGRPWIRTGLGLRRWHPPVPPTWLPTRPTECILFDPRLIHAGGPVGERKIAAFLAFGADDPHTRRHRRHFGCRDNPYRLPLSGYLSERGLA